MVNMFNEPKSKIENEKWNRRNYNTNDYFFGYQ